MCEGGKDVSDARIAFDADITGTGVGWEFAKSANSVLYTEEYAS